MPASPVTSGWSLLAWSRHILATGPNAVPVLQDISTGLKDIIRDVSTDLEDTVHDMSQDLEDLEIRRCRCARAYEKLFSPECSLSEKIKAAELLIEESVIPGIDSVKEKIRVVQQKLRDEARIAFVREKNEAAMDLKGHNRGIINDHLKVLTEYDRLETHRELDDVKNDLEELKTLKTYLIDMIKTTERMQGKDAVFHDKMFKHLGI